jgi:O-antigen/teichoic acid export membrane protein
MVLAPVMMSSALLMGLVVEIIPKYHKWAVALPMFYIFVLSSFLVSFSAPLVNLLNALGKVRISLTFMILWTVIMWIFTPTLTHFYGTIGFPVAHLLVSSTFIFIVLTVQKEIKFSFLRPIYKPILSAIILGLVVFILRSVLPFNNLITFFVAGSAGLLTYIAVLSLLFKVNLAEEIKFFIKK